MKLGVENKAKTKWAIGLFVFAIVLAIYNFGADQRLASPVPAVHQKKITETVKTVSDSALRADLFQARQQITYPGNIRNIFTMKEEKQVSIPDADKQNVTKDEADKLPQTSETPLPIDLKFFGYFRKSGEPKKICILQGETIFLGQEGSMVALHYKILEIKSNSVLVQDVLSNQQQSIALLQ